MLKLVNGLKIINGIKKSGLLDQLACATGGMITIDFANYENPEVVKLDSKVIQDKYDFFITPTGEDHSALDGEYTAITVEMKAISQFFGKEYLKDVSMDDIMANLPALREKAWRPCSSSCYPLHYRNRTCSQISCRS